jgi:hypothetical protein
MRLAVPRYSTGCHGLHFSMSIGPALMEPSGAKDIPFSASSQVKWSPARSGPTENMPPGTSFLATPLSVLLFVNILSPNIVSTDSEVVSATSLWLTEVTTELESLLSRNVIEWSAANAGDAYARLRRLTDEVGRLS